MYKHYFEMTPREKARYLVNTSADDLKSSLTNHTDLEVLRLARRITVRRGERTKTLYLNRAIKRLENEAVLSQPAPAIDDKKE